MGETVAGIEVLASLGGHGGFVTRFAWSPDGRYLATGAADNLVRVWEPETRTLVCTLGGHFECVSCVAWSPDGTRIATGSADKTVRIWSVYEAREIHALHGHFDFVRCVVWSQDGHQVASGSQDGYIRLWDPVNGKSIAVIDTKGWVLSLDWSAQGRPLASGGGDGFLRLFEFSKKRKRPKVDAERLHEEWIDSVSWSPEGKILASGSGDRTVRIWDTDLRRPVQVLEVHTEQVRAVSFSGDGGLLASKSDDGSTRLWSTKTWECLGTIREANGHNFWPPGLAFHPREDLLASFGDDERTVAVRRIDRSRLWDGASAGGSVQYAAAKIVLVGESGVGKSGLGWRLAHNEFKSQESTHGQKFWLLPTLGTTRDNGMHCEAVLWDLAGQPDYRLIHGLFLDDADLALILFHPADRHEPLRGVDYWLKSLGKRPDRPCRTILVGSRCDVGEPTLTVEAIGAFCRERGISGGYVRTSALKGEGLEELVERMREQVDWGSMSTTTTTESFKRIKEYVLSLKEDSAQSGVLASWDDLRDRLQARDPEWRFDRSELQTAVDHLSKHGYVRVLRTSSGESLVLLRPELLNNLGASFVLKARHNRKGLGSLDEGMIRSEAAGLPEVEGLSDRERMVLLDATTALFVANNMAFREVQGESSYLVFPDLINLRTPAVADHDTSEDLAYLITGSIENLYARLVVLLGYTSLFARTDQGQNQARYEFGPGEICVLRQSFTAGGELELVLCYGAGTKRETQQLFRGLIDKFLAGRNIEVLHCPPITCKCGYRAERTEVVKRLRQGLAFLFCSNCGWRIALPLEADDSTLSDPGRRLRDQEFLTSTLRTRYETALTFLLSYLAQQRGKIESPKCFISYAWGNPDHEEWVEKELARGLQSARIQVLLDRWHNVETGASIPRFIGLIDECKYTIVVASPLYLDKFRNRMSARGNIVAAELDLILHRLTATEEEKRTVLPILLDGEPDESLPPLLRGRVYRDFRSKAHFFSELFDLVLSIHGVSFEDRAVIDLRDQLRGSGKALR